MSIRIRPLHVSKFVPPPFAGVEAHIDTLLRALAPEIKATLVAGSFGVGRIEEGEPYRIVAAGSLGRVGNLPLSPKVIGIVREELRSGRSNLLHLHAPNPIGDLSALLGAKDIPVVMTWHSDIVRQKAVLKYYRYFQRKALMRADRIVVSTPKHYESSEQLHQFDLSHKISIIPYGIDFEPLDKGIRDFEVLDKVEQFSCGRPVVLTIGRHVYYKGYGHLLSAMAKVRSDAVLVMIGTGPLTTDFQKQVLESGLKNRILFLGETSTLALISILHRCDYFCLPSVEPSEAFGIATAEAMACGKPAIVCELNNGVNFLNKDGITGITVQPRNIDELASAIDTLALDESLRSKLGVAARTWVRSQFSIGAMRSATIELYSQLV